MFIFEIVWYKVTTKLAVLSGNDSFEQGEQDKI